MFASEMTTIETAKNGVGFDIWTVDDNIFEIKNSRDKVRAYQTFLIKFHIRR